MIAMFAIPAAGLMLAIGAFLGSNGRRFKSCQPDQRTCRWNACWRSSTTRSSGNWSMRRVPASGLLPRGPGGESQVAAAVRSRWSRHRACAEGRSARTAFVYLS
jgi:hypothetical protein